MNRSSTNLNRMSPAAILRLTGLTLLVALAALLRPLALQAASSDTVHLYVTPVVTYGVQITSVNTSGYDFETVDLGGVSKSTAAIIVRNTGDVASQWQLRVTPTQNWAPAADPGADEFELMAVFTSTASAAAPDASEFTDAQDEVLLNYQTANGTSSAGRYNTGTNLNSIPPSRQANSARNLWLQLRTPTSSSSGQQQSCNLYITAVQTGQP